MNKLVEKTQEPSNEDILREISLLPEDKKEILYNISKFHENEKFWCVTHGVDYVNPGILEVLIKTYQELIATYPKFSS